MFLRSNLKVSSLHLGAVSAKIDYLFVFTIAVLWHIGMGSSVYNENEWGGKEGTLIY
jgi:hypothetical protein